MLVRRWLPHRKLKISLRVGKMAQSIKCLLCRHKALSQFSASMYKLGVVEHACNPSAGEEERSLGLHGQPAYLN